MSFHDIRFPLHLSYGSQGGPGFNTNVIELSSGIDERIPRWSTPRYSYDIASLIRSVDDMHEVVKFYNARTGIANSFRFLDWQDYSSAPNGKDVPTPVDILLATADGTSQTFQLVKYYISGNESTIRAITKPIHNEAIGDPYNLPASASVRVALNDVETTTGWSVNTTTGIIMFDSPPIAGTTIKAGFYFDTPVYFGQELDPRFSVSAEDFNTESVDSIPMVESRGNTVVYEEVNFGGDKYWGNLTANQEITLIDGRLHQFTDDTGIRIVLPDFTDIPTGGPMFALLNINGTMNTQVWDNSQSTLVTTLVPDRLITIWLGTESGGQKLWLPSG